MCSKSSRKPFFLIRRVYNDNVIENSNKKIEIIFLMEILKLQNTASEIKNSFERLNESMEIMPP